VAYINGRIDVVSADTLQLFKSVKIYTGFLDMSGFCKCASQKFTFAYSAEEVWGLCRISDDP